MPPTSRGPDPGTRLRTILVVLVLAPVVGFAAWWFIQSTARVGVEPLSCGECGVEAHSPVAGTGVVLSIILGLMIIPILRTAGVGIVLVNGAAGAVHGWRGAVADGRLTPEAVAGWIGFWSTVAAVGTVLVVVGVLVEVRMPGPTWRLFGWAPAPGPAEFCPRLGSGRRPGSTTVTFVLHDGTRRESTVRLGPHWDRLDDLELYEMVAWYRLRDPSRVRVVPSATRPLVELLSAPAGRPAE